MKTFLLTEALMSKAVAAYLKTHAILNTTSGLSPALITDLESVVEALAEVIPEDAQVSPPSVPTTAVEAPAETPVVTNAPKAD